MLKVVGSDVLKDGEALLVSPRRIIQNTKTGKHELESLEDWSKRCCKITNLK